MRLLHRLVSASLVVGCAFPALAVEPAQSKQAPSHQDAQAQGKAMTVDAALAGEYSLGGVMETGSGLLLRSDGSFEDVADFREELDRLERDLPGEGQLPLLGGEAAEKGKRR